MPEKQQASDEKAFGGAGQVFSVSFENEDHPFYKASAQRDTANSDEVPHPHSEKFGDMILHWNDLRAANSYHARCIRSKVACTVGLGLEMLEGDQKKLLERMSLVNDYGESFLEVMQRVGLDFEATGNGYMEVVTDGKGDPAEFYYMPSTRTTARKLQRGLPRTWYYLQDSGERTSFEIYNPKTAKARRSYVLHFAQPSTGSRYYGTPDWEGCTPDIELAHYAKLYNRQFFINSGVPDVAIIVENGRLDKKTEQVVADFFRANFQGVMNSHRALYLPVEGEDANVRIEPVGGSMKDRDMSFKELSDKTRDGILSAHGVPPRLAGVVASGQLGGGGEVGGQFKLYKELVIDPRQEIFETKLRPVFAAMGLGEVQFKDMDVSIQEARSTLYPALVAANIITDDEAREEMGYAPFSDGQRERMNPTPPEPEKTPEGGGERDTDPTDEAIAALQKARAEVAQ